MNLLLAAILLVVPVQSKLAWLVWQGHPHTKIIALTFDAGADRGYAARILWTLERNHVHATFGMTGRWARESPNLVRRMHRDHDAFINHTYDHRSFTGFSQQAGPLSDAQRAWEITQADRVIRWLTGHSSKPFFRPPYGDYDRATLALAHRLGYQYVVMWTIDSLGWDYLPASEILARCVSRARSGTIILMHVGADSQDALALGPLIGQLKSRHFRFATIPQLLRAH